MSFCSSIRYSDLKIFNFPEFFKNIYSNNPIHIRLKPTNRCNHNCSYCAYRNSNQSLGKEMNLRDEIPYKKLQEIIDGMHKLGVKAVTFSGGGEPLLYKDLLGILRRLAVNNIKTGILTNGSLLTGEIAKEIAFRSSWVRISIDGWDDKSYCAYRGVKPGSFDKLLDNIRKFIALGGSCKLGVSIIVNKDNAKHLCELIRKLYACGVTEFKISPCIISDNCEKNYNYHNKIRKTIDKQLAEANWRLNLNIKYHFHQLDSFKKNYTLCPNLCVRPVIGADQNIYSCQDKAYTTAGMIGSIKGKSFEEAWRQVSRTKINPMLDCRHHCVSNKRNMLINEFLNLDRGHIEFI